MKHNPKIAKGPSKNVIKFRHYMFALNSEGLQVSPGARKSFTESRKEIYNVFFIQTTEFLPLIFVNFFIITVPVPLKET